MRTTSPTGSSPTPRAQHAEPHPSYQTRSKHSPGCSPGLWGQIAAEDKPDPTHVRSSVTDDNHGVRQPETQQVRGRGEQFTRVLELDPGLAGLGKTVEVVMTSDKVL